MSASGPSGPLVFSYNMMYYRISKNEKILFFWKKNRPGVSSDLKFHVKHHQVGGNAA